MEQEKIKKVRKSLVTSGFFKNPVISFSVLRAIKVPKTTRFSEFFFCFNAKKLELNFCIIPFSHPTHILTHNGISAYGQSSTKQYSVTPKFENRCIFENKYLKAKIPSCGQI